MNFALVKTIKFIYSEVISAETKNVIYPMLCVYTLQCINYNKIIQPCQLNDRKLNFVPRYTVSFFKDKSYFKNTS